MMVDGRFLKLPKNVWFMGTANNDETTKDFADKTYDRSFVLELPGQPLPFKLENQRPRDPVSMQSLVQAFDKAAASRKTSARKAWTWLDEHLRGPLGEHFRVGFGGRLQTQLGRVVPVIMACGGTLGEGLDQIIATRLLRRIRDRHDLVVEEVRDVLEIIEGNWPDKKCQPKASTKLLQRELRRLGAEV